LVGHRSSIRKRHNRNSSHAHLGFRTSPHRLHVAANPSRLVGHRAVTSVDLEAVVTSVVLAEAGSHPMPASMARCQAARSIRTALSGREVADTPVVEDGSCGFRRRSRVPGPTTGSDLDVNTIGHRTENPTDRSIGKMSRRSGKISAVSQTGHLETDIHRCAQGKE
jgi:hypothetical protein